ncbi:uncharacterized protein Ecym_4782 [Eremothecium cymbalariae DBVPG|uniref:Uncharacterized protein n=1 Tax=Eremothecium cymbalariae (strain CBS 270.75 / DBVPG 7215 / KCTC 17166 / NRRL Y-17582) TaxID=931890 RepID=G8JSS2_ERECY|nr:hypothetical protein Ecym_4782 [Eremothecium cymbalariae DBVPG\
MKKQEQDQLFHLIVQHLLDSLQLIWTMSKLCFYLESLPKQDGVDVINNKDKDQLLQWVDNFKLHLHDKVAESQLDRCRDFVDKTMLPGICAIKDKMQAQLQHSKEIILVNQLSNCFNGFIHTLQFIRKLPIGNSQASYEIPSEQWKVLLQEQDQMNSNWKLQLNKFSLLSAQLVASNGAAKEQMSQFYDHVYKKCKEVGSNQEDPERPERLIF